MRTHNADVKELEEFEASADFDNLPHSRDLMCYMQCLLEAFGIMDTPLPAYVEALSGIITSEELEIYRNMAKGCWVADKKAIDLCESSYEINVCMKKNDNKHYYLAF